MSERCHGRIDGVESPASGALRPRLWCCTTFLQPIALASARNCQRRLVWAEKAAIKDTARFLTCWCVRVSPADWTRVWSRCGPQGGCRPSKEHRNVVYKAERGKRSRLLVENPHENLELEVLAVPIEGDALSSWVECLQGRPKDENPRLCNHCCDGVRPHAADAAHQGCPGR